MAQRPFLSICLAAALCSGPAHAQTRCIDESRVAPAAALSSALSGAVSDERGAFTSDRVDPRSTLRGLVRDALDRSPAAGTGRPLADGAGIDMTETRIGLVPGAALSMREQLAMNTVALALDRSRYRQHAVIYRQYVRRMDCLVEALESIVRADRGRAGELVQAQEVLQQAQRLQTGAQTQAREIDVRLRRLVGDGLPGVQGLSTVLLNVEALSELIADVESSTEIGQTTARMATATIDGRAMAGGGKPEVSWAFTSAGAPAVGSNPDTPGGGRGGGIGRIGNFSVGLAVHIPLYSPGLAPASGAARRRVEAARLRREEALEARRYRVVEVHELTLASFDRARRMGAVLRDSEQLRNLTLQQWQRLDPRSLSDTMGAEAEHYRLRVAYIDALNDGQQLNAMLLSLGRGVQHWLH